ncbi:RluA family pseudouridine synthase [Aestuariibaculum sp. YM273]|uniref:RluA family pseudouridine synthase n=1 Tax=Aestuariibaculum sp. YM273 TaxID=3070659 RepID=UPI0027DC2300|nr:RluA family pseudouridine synthase [Aestuariibaculum sp. YM273]WMI65364.1 RluA family pseudouridine synthase [Aestuariibaculum sp. YM273]
MTHFCDSRFHPLQHSEKVALPEKFTFPFYYEPHELCVEAAKDLQTYLKSQTDFIHNFGLDQTMEGLIIGKMFGVMVVKNDEGRIGYLAAFSGKLSDNNYLEGFVPPIYNTLNVDGFYKKGEAELNVLNRQIENLESATELQKAKDALKKSKALAETEIKALKALMKAEKKKRNKKRDEAKPVLSDEAFQKLFNELKEQSIGYQLRLKYLKYEWEQKIKQAEIELNNYLQPIADLKDKRAKQSSGLQKRIHQQYQFLNAEGEVKDLLGIFKDTKSPIPPAGSGECAAPKLFQYAYENGFKPIAMAEFWWGASPKSEVRKHKQFYPSCRSKCEPILGHMMQGLQVDANPIEQVISYEADLEIVYEDEYLLLVNKPHEFLSVPGKTYSESVLTKMRAYLPKAKGPLLVHRLDMSTSGLLLVSKSERIHKHLQKQFIERTVKKRYVALLDGELKTKTGQVDLPLRVDLDNRPQQLVCYEHGKPAVTNFEVQAIENGKTRIHFYPVTGRTHQLRVHAAHSKGLQIPIIGDDLYGVKANRLHLHAEQLTFVHPIKKEVLTIVCEAPF